MGKNFDEWGLHEIWQANYDKMIVHFTGETLREKSLEGKT